MKTLLIKIISVFIILINGFIFLGFPAKKQFMSEKETRIIYNSIITEITELNGSFKQSGGRVLEGFTLTVSFSEPNADDVNRIIVKVENMGFKKTNRTLKYDNQLFCKENSGFLISVQKPLRIDYENKMSYCH